MRINIPAKRRNTLRIPSDKGIFRPKRAFLGGNSSIPFGYTFETEFGTYGVNLSEGYARCDGKQVSLTEEQIREIGGIIDRQWEASEK